MKTFDYRKPASIDEVKQLRAEYGASSQFLLGGTDLTVEMDQGLLSPQMLIDLKGIEELKEIREEDGQLFIGAGASFSSIIKSPLLASRFPSLVEASRLVASVGVRNVAGLGGNICHAVPSADGAAPLLARDAELDIASVHGARSVSIHDFFTGPRRTSLGEDELLTGIRIPNPKGAFGENYRKLGRYRGEDLAQVGVAVHVDASFNYRIAYSAVGPVPLRIREAEALLQGAAPDAKKVEKAVDIIRNTVSPIDDIRSSREYRLYMCGVLFEKALTTAMERMK